jgi:hypothetical protein
VTRVEFGSALYFTPPGTFLRAIERFVQIVHALGPALRFQQSVLPGRGLFLQCSKDVVGARLYA